MMIFERMSGLFLLSVKVVHAPPSHENLGPGHGNSRRKKLQFPNKLNYYKWQGKIFPTPYEGLFYEETGESRARCRTGGLRAEASIGGAPRP
jgi:hypothetical protein